METGVEGGEAEEVGEDVDWRNGELGCDLGDAFVVAADALWRLPDQAMPLALDIGTGDAGAAHCCSIYSCTLRGVLDPLQLPSLPSPKLSPTLSVSWLLVALRVPPAFSFADRGLLLLSLLLLLVYPFSPPCCLPLKPAPLLAYRRPSAAAPCSVPLVCSCFPSTVPPCF